MVDLCSIPFDASRRLLQFICGSETPTQCSFDARVEKTPEKVKNGGFSPKISQKYKKIANSGISTLPLSRYSIRKFQKDVFLGLFPMYLQADKHGDFCAIFEWRFGAPNDVRTWNRTLIKGLVSSSVDKLVKEFLRYLYRCGNGAIPPISPETTKNDPTLEPPGGRPFRLGKKNSPSPSEIVQSSYKFVNPVLKFRVELRQHFAPIGSRRKFGRPSDRK